MSWLRLMKELAYQVPEVKVKPLENSRKEIIMSWRRMNLDIQGAIGASLILDRCMMSEH